MVSIAYKASNGKLDHVNRYSQTELRNLMRKYYYHEEYDEKGDFVSKDFIYDPDRNNPPVPPWWEKKGDVHSRVPRGSAMKFTSSLNSAITNKRLGHINDFKMKFKSKKEKIQSIHFEDKGYPAFIKEIKSRYWFTDTNHKRKTISLSDIDSGCIEIIHDKNTDRYFLHCPVPVDWFPEDDRRSEKQAMFTAKGDRIIALDPGVRKFLLGYDPNGKSVFFGEGASLILTQLLLAVDKAKKEALQRGGQSPDKHKLWTEIRNMVTDLHWKCIDYLIKNYDTILLPDFRISQMVTGKNGRKLSKMTKRLMYMFSFHQFRQKLTWKCSLYNKKLYIVDESFTSKTCTGCGVLNDTKGKENLQCKSCDLIIDRDVAGSRNILIKNILR